jgi:transcriptional regulator with XRE-family HTH domain
MTAVERVFDDYVRAHRTGGEADPQAFLARVPPRERRELAALIDSYLTRCPRQSFDPAAFRGSVAERTVDQLERVLSGQAGLWPSLLPRLRHRLGLRRTQLVEQLAAALGVADRSDRVGEYYHQMEQGTLPAAGVSARVLQALAQILGESAEALRSAGAPVHGGAHPTVHQPAYTRLSYSTRDPAATSTPGGHRGEAAGALPAEAEGAAPEAASEWDQIDQLFRGG